MCIIIDTNTLASVFSEDSEDHVEFKPVKDWIFNGAGKVVWGGSKYIEELKKAHSYLVLINRLTSARLAVMINSEVVDKEAEYVTSLITHSDFDDQHLVGLLRTSGCKLICSKDKRAYPYFRHNLFFKPASYKPHIYSASRNASLLQARHIADICKPCSNTTNAQKFSLGII